MSQLCSLDRFTTVQLPWFSEFDSYSFVMFLREEFLWFETEFNSWDNNLWFSESFTQIKDSKDIFGCLANHCQQNASLHNYNWLDQNLNTLLIMIKRTFAIF